MPRAQQEARGKCWCKGEGKRHGSETGEAGADRLQNKCVGELVDEERLNEGVDTELALLITQTAWCASVQAVQLEALGPDAESGVDVAIASPVADVDVEEVDALDIRNT